MSAVRARSFVVVGGGPAGLTAAIHLVRSGAAVTVVERGSTVGGIARTEEYKGFRFDMGGHRFFTKLPEVQRLWEELLPGDFLRRRRLSRIYYRGRFFHYPLRPLEALRRLGVVEAARIVASYVRWRIRPSAVEETFEQWVTNRFGRRLFETFFRAYTEKVWGMPCSELRAEWAAQRIKNLSLPSILLGFIGRRREVVASLIEEFHYPRRGPGMMWQAAAAEVERGGGAVRLGRDVTRIIWEPGRVTGVEVRHGGVVELVGGTDVISTMPVTEFVKRLDPPPPAHVLAAAGALRYRDLLIVCLIVDRPSLFPDNWIYVHDPAVKVARIQNFKNWSPDMVPDPGKTSLGLEYFCNEGDPMWRASDRDLVDLGRSELERIGLGRARDVEDGCVFRVRNAYPVYDGAYAAQLATIRRFMEGLANCQTVGRNGLHRYNNQDHSMATALAAARNLLYGERTDVWSLNADGEYHEEARRAPDPAGAVPDTPPVKAAATAAALVLAAALVVFGGGADIGQGLTLLAEYVPLLARLSR
ncbi:MAG TPA: NAD(P)/FAD-dependent oxidoreductase [Vicinamibacteria bacterium]|nr:NAD(P)/FAD-dependent oxidoreductase [Vicinamibacteria bacterium]